MSGTRRSGWRGLIAGGALGTVVVTLGWSALLASRLTELNDLEAWDGVRLTVLLAATYLPLLGAGALPMLLARGRSGSARSGTDGFVAGAIGAAAALLLASLLFRWAPAYRAISPEGAALLPMGALDLLALGAAFLVFLVGVARGPRGRGAPWLAVGLLGVGGLHLLNRWYETPTPAAPHPPASAASCSPRSGAAPGLVLLALDGMTWRVATPMLEAGELPELASLLAAGTSAPLDPGFPSYSPVVWATIATGLPASEHHVHGFMRMRVHGIETPISQGPLLNSFNWWGGANRLLSLLSGTPVGWARFEPIPSTQRRGHALWDVAGAHGHVVGVYDWMNTWPVQAVHGYMYSHTSVSGGRSSPEVAAVVDAAPVEPFDGPARLERYNRFFSEAWALYEAFQPTVSVHFNKGIDDLHDGWGDGYLNLPIDPGRRRPEVVAAAYRLADHWIGRFREATPAGWIFAIVSDHGYEFDGTGHNFSPPGVLVLSGGPFACGRRLEAAHVLDVAPTLLGALGLPVDQAMPGRVLEAAWAGEAPTPTRVAGFPAEWRAAPVDEAGEESGDWSELQERLRALGYAN